MKKNTFIFLLLIPLISISACSSKTSNKIKIEANTEKSNINIEKPITYSYESLDKLPQKYNSQLAEKNGDVVNIKGKSANIEKLDKFVEDYKNNKVNIGNMVRITVYTDEGDAIIQDLTIDSEGIKLIEDMTRDNFSSAENRNKTEYNIVDIWRTIKVDGIFYIAKTDKGEEKILFYDRQVINSNDISQIKTNENNKISEINMTWGEFLDLYLKENPQVKYYNPRTDINIDHKVRVVKIEYPNGLESKAGFYSYALITEVYEAKTGELLTSAGEYKNKR